MIYQAIAQAFRTFFETTTETTARQTQFVIWRSKLTGAVFVRTLVSGWAGQPEASLNDLAETAADLGATTTAQGLEDRINAAAVDLFEVLSQESLRWFQRAGRWMYPCCASSRRSRSWIAVALPCRLRSRRAIRVAAGMARPLV